MVTASLKHRILLIYPPNDPEIRARGFNYSSDDCQPLGLAYVAAALEEAGYEVRVIDAKAEALSAEAILSKVAEFRPRLVGMSVSTADFRPACSLAARIRESGDYVLLIGGRHVSALPKESLQEGPFDYGIIGEGERTAVELADAVFGCARDSIPSIHGLVFRDGQTVIRTSEREYIENLDTLPFPARHLFPPLNRYPYLYYNRSLPVATIITSRGCPYGCVFCDQAVFGNRVRVRSIPNILDEIEMLVRDYHVNDINIIDDIFPLNSERVREFCHGLLSRKLQVSWACGGRVDSVDKEMLVTMKQAGCWMIGYGIESGSQAVLDAVKKQVTLDTIERAVRLTRQAGIRAAGTFVLGLPGEDKESIRKTLRYSKRLALDRSVFVILLPLPGSDLYRKAMAGGQFEGATGSRHYYNCCFPEKLPYVSDDLSLEVLRKYRSKAFRDFYLRPSHLARRFFIYHEFKGLPMRVRAFFKLLF